MKKFNKVFVAGTFDFLHIGHQYLLWTAANSAKSLVVIVARDENVLRIKGKLPHFTVKERIDRPYKNNINVKILLSDELHDRNIITNYLWINSGYGFGFVEEAIVIVGNGEIKEIVKQKVLKELLKFSNDEISIEPFIDYKSRIESAKNKNKSPKKKELAKYYLFKYANEFFVKKLRKDKDARIRLHYEKETISLPPIRNDLYHKEFDEFLDNNTTAMDGEIDAQAIHFEEVAS